MSNSQLYCYANACLVSLSLSFSFLIIYRIFQCHFQNSFLFLLLIQSVSFSFIQCRYEYLNDLNCNCQSNNCTKPKRSIALCSNGRGRGREKNVNNISRVFMIRYRRACVLKIEIIHNRKENKLKNDRSDRIHLSILKFINN